jgi:hypothetical protein
MTWLVHHEFGATHRPFVFGSAKRPEEFCLDGPTVDLAYWIARWIDVYANLLDVLREGHPNIVPVSHERLCTEPGYRQSLARKVGVSDLVLPERMLGWTDDRLPGANFPSVGAASAIHGELDAISRRVLLDDG